MTVLIVHASDHGSTREMAERIAARLSEAGHTAEARSVEEAGDPSEYEAVVLGSAIHSQAWLPEATRYAKRHASVLAERPVWLFSVSLVGDTGSAFPAAVGKRLQKLKERRPPKAAVEIRDAIRPRGSRSFTGSIQPDHWGRLGRTVFKLLGGKWGDHRDWDEVEGWAQTIAGELGAAGADGAAGASD